MSTIKRETRESQEFKVPPKFKFSEGEKVLCFHGPLIYEAKCLQSRYEEKDKVNQYHIHYSGWNKSWDEWVPEARVLKYNDANLQKQKELHKAQKAEPKGKRGKRKSVTGKESPSVREADSRSSTPVDKPSFSRLSTSGTSSQESSSDIPRRKRSKIDPTVESSPAPAKEVKEKKKGRASVVGIATPLPPKVAIPEKDSPAPAKEVKEKKKGKASVGGNTIPLPPKVTIPEKDSPAPAKEVKEKKKGKASVGGNTIPLPPKVTIPEKDEEQFLTKLEIKIKLPDELKPILVDDWEFITKQKRLVKIPNKYTVESILADYCKQRQTLKQQIISKEEARIEVTDGIREYFNGMLGNQLLYRSEKKQFQSLKSAHPDLLPSKLYGPIHLLRLFVKIGVALAYTRLDERTVQHLVLHFHDFLKFLHKNSSTYISPQDYTAPIA